MEKEAISNALNDLLKHEEFLACMVANQDMSYIMPTTDKNDVGANKMLDDFKQKPNNIFKMINGYSEAKLKQMKWTLKDCEAWFYVIPDFQSILISIVPKLSNEGLIEVELEKARQKILEIYKEKADQST